MNARATVRSCSSSTTRRPIARGSRTRSTPPSSTRQDHLACVASIDDNVGRLLDRLDRDGLARDTLVEYSSDNGFFLGEHGWHDKRFMYAESLRIPLLAVDRRAAWRSSFCDCSYHDPGDHDTRHADVRAALEAELSRLKVEFGDDDHFADSQLPYGADLAAPSDPASRR